MVGRRPLAAALHASTSGDASTGPAALDSLARSLVAASADRVARAVALVDAMPTRGEADGLIAPLRLRLAKLRPARRTGFARLLFTPLDPIVVPLEAWSRGSPGVPRAALAMLARAVRDGWQETGGPTLANVDAQLRAMDTSDRGRLLSLGEPVWAQAAIILRTARPPADWRRISGLADDDFRPLAHGVAMVLAHAETVMGPGIRQNSQVRLDAVLLPICRSALALQASLVAPVGTVAQSPAPPNMTPVATLLAVLMIGATRGDRAMAMLEEAAAGNAAAARAGRLAVDFVLGEALREVGRAALPQLVPMVGRITTLLGGLNALMQFRPAARQRLMEVGAALDRICRGRFATALDDVVGLDPAANASQRLETLADARALAVTAAGLGDRGAYALALRQAAEKLGGPTVLGLADEERQCLQERLAAPLEPSSKPS